MPISISVDNNTINIKCGFFKTEYVKIGGNGAPIEVTTSEAMEAALVIENIGKIYKYVGTTNETFTKGNLYQIVEIEEEQ